VKYTLLILFLFTQGCALPIIGAAAGGGSFLFNKHEHDAYDDRLIHLEEQLQKFLDQQEKMNGKT